MGKTKDLLETLDAMIECGNTLIASANALKVYFSDVSATKQKENPPAKQEPEKTYTLEEVRAILSAKSKAGFREQVKEMITKRGVDNLTKLDASEYPSLVKEVEELGNG